MEEHRRAAYLQNISESSFIPSKGKVKDLLGHWWKAGVSKEGLILWLPGWRWARKVALQSAWERVLTLLSLMTVAPGTLPGRNQPGPSGSAVHREGLIIRHALSLWPACQSPCVPEHRAHRLIPGELGSRGRTRAGRGSSLGGAGECAATHLGLTCTPWACSSPLPATFTPSLGLPWCVLTLGGVLGDAHPWMPRQTDPTPDLHFRELTHVVVSHFKQKWNLELILGLCCHMEVILGMEQRKEKLNSSTAGWICTAGPAASG